MEHVYWLAAAMGLSVGISYWLTVRAIAGIPKVEAKREVHIHRERESGDFPHPKCDYCNCIVARHKMDSDSKVICFNCARERES